MNPRLKTSKKWTAFPPELINQILSAFEENFRAKINETEIIVEGRIYPQEILLRVGLLEKGRIKQKNFEISAEYSPDNENAVQKIFLSVDAAASLLLDYMDQEKNQDDENVESDLDLPSSWREMEFNQEKIYVQFSTVNSKLEAEADRILGLDKSQELYVDEEEDFDQDARFDEARESDPDEDPEGRGNGSSSVH